jgi:monoamine oxidase
MADDGATGERRRLTRRGFAGAAATGTLGAVVLGRLPGDRGDGAADASAASRRGNAPKRADVVVVGAGPAGLAAATRIAGAGRSVVVLEARQRVGGRVKNWRCGMPPACDCGQLVAPAHSRIRALAGELGVNLYPQHATATGQGNEVIYVDGQRGETPAGGPLNSRAIAPLVADARVPFTELDSMAATISPESPWNAKRAAEWDAMTVETWKERNTLSVFGRFWIDLLTYVATTAHPSEVSLLHLLAYLSRLGDGRHGTDEVLDFVFRGDLAEGGLEQVPDGLAKRLGRRVVLGAAVRRIVQRNGHARVESDAVSVLAKRVIVATAPSLNALIDFEPGLPGLRAQLAQRYPQGSVTTFAAIYKRPFWRDRGLTGRAAGLQPFYVVADNSPPDGSSGRLVAQTYSAQQRHYARLPAKQRRRAMLDNLATYFGDDARKPLMTLERNWTGAVRVDAPWVDDVEGSWTRGCPGYLPPGVLQSFGPAIREPFGRVHWANTEHSVSYNTYVEGAVRSAEAVAGQVLAEL